LWKTLERGVYERLEKAVDEPVEAIAINRTQGGELDAHSFAARNVADDGMSADFAFGHGEEHRDDFAEGGRGVRFDEEAADVEVADAADGLLVIFVVPSDPDAARCRDTRETAHGLGGLLVHGKFRLP